MDFDPPESVRPILEKIEKFVADIVMPVEHEIFERGFTESAAQLTALRDQVKAAGLWGPQIPKELGGLGREELHHLLYQMLLGRRFEEKCAESYALGKIGGFCHLYIGQEAVVVGLELRRCLAREGRGGMHRVGVVIGAGPTVAGGEADAGQDEERGNRQDGGANGCRSHVNW